MPKHDKEIPLEPEYNLVKSKGGYTETGYTIEARINATDFLQINNQNFDQHWRQIKFDQDGINLLMSKGLNKKLSEHGLLSYSAAQSLRWWFHSLAEDSNAYTKMFFETRLVKHHLNCTHEVKALHSIDHV